MNAILNDTPIVKRGRGVEILLRPAGLLGPSSSTTNLERGIDSWGHTATVSASLVHRTAGKSASGLQANITESNTKGFASVS